MFTDIKIFDHQEPIEELKRCYKLHKRSYFESEPEDLIEITKEIENFLKRILMSEDFLTTSPTQWGEAEKQALNKFLNWSNYGAKIRTDNRIDQHLLKALQKQYT